MLLGLSYWVTELILFSYLALVFLGAWRFLHHRPMARQMAAIGGSFLGIGLFIGAAEWRYGPDLAFRNPCFDVVCSLFCSLPRTGHVRSITGCH
jgi:hypothetical protein